jgi:hypothetical protein
MMCKRDQHGRKISVKVRDVVGGEKVGEGR